MKSAHAADAQEVSRPCDAALSSRARATRRGPQAHPRTRAVSLALPFLLLCAVVPAARAQSPVATSAGTEAGAPRGAITVRVFDEAGQPVRNASVITFQQGRAGRFSYDNTDAASGRYVIGNLDPGLYRVSVNAPGYVPEIDPSTAPADANYYRPGDNATFRLMKGGVITGRVTDAEGNPVVGARVSAVRVRTPAGATSQEGRGISVVARERRTDDRGVYRLYGLLPGSYVVSAGGRSFTGNARPNAYDADAPTYYPSAPRDGAAEVQVQAGQETTDIDIRHRGDKGHAVSGTVTGAFAAAPQPGFGSFASVNLSYASDGTPAGATFLQGDAPARGFYIEGVPDGDYELTATSQTGPDNGMSAPPLRVSVRGADVTGLSLTLAPLASLTGRIAFEPQLSAPPAEADATKIECRPRRDPSLQELLLTASREDGTPLQSRRVYEAATENAPRARGFTISGLQAGRYRIDARLLDENLYVRSITLPTVSAQAANASAAPGVKNAPRAAMGDLARDGFAIRAGERLDGALITIASGAAGLRGRVVPAGDGESLPDNLRAHLVPAERERADDVLRYAEATVQPDGTFTFKNLAPGKYLLLARAAGKPGPRGARPLAWDAAARASLRRDAEAAKNPIELQPCQRAEDFTLRFARARANSER